MIFEIIYAISLNELAEAALEFVKIRSLAQFAEWFGGLSTGVKIIYGLGIIGFLITIYIFIVAIFTDKH